MKECSLALRTPAAARPRRAKARSRAMPTRPRVPFVEEAADERDAVRHAALGANFGSGCAGSGAQSLRAWPTSTKPARRVSDGWPVWFEMVSISSRSEGTRSRSTFVEDPRHLFARRDGASGRPGRSPPRTGTATAGRCSARRPGTCIFSWSTPRLRVSSSKAAAASAKRIVLSEPYGQSGSATSTGTSPEPAAPSRARRDRRRWRATRPSTSGSSRRAARRRSRPRRSRAGSGTLATSPASGPEIASEHEQRVLDAAGHGAELVERPAQRHGARARHAAVGRAQADDAAAHGGRDDAAARLAGHGEGDAAGGGGRARSRAAARRRPPRGATGCWSRRRTRCRSGRARPGSASPPAPRPRGAAAPRRRRPSSGTRSRKGSAP